MDGLLQQYPMHTYYMKICTKIDFKLYSVLLLALYNTHSHRTAFCGWAANAAFAISSLRLSSQDDTRFQYMK